MTQEAERLFLEAVDLPREQRRAFLLEHCATEELRSEVETLLAGDDRAESFIESAVVEAAESLQQATDERAAAASLKTGRFPPGTMLGGRFRIDGLLGKGGMG